MLRPTIVVTAFAIAGQAVNFLVFVAAAALFGATSGMDAFLVAVTLPQYVTAVLLNSLGFVLIPVFVRHRAHGREGEAWAVAGGVLSVCLVGLVVLAALGMFLAEPLLRLTAPGLDNDARAVATQAALVTWPMIVPTGAFSLLSGLYQAYGRFGRPAAAPVVGGLTTLALLPWLVPRFGVIGLAAATTAGAAAQAALLLPVPRLEREWRLRLPPAWRHPGVQEVFRLVVPLVVLNLVARWTPVVERFLASGLLEGSIARLGYAFMLATALSKFLSTGIATVIFPRMAMDAAAADRARLRRRLSFGLRTMWLAVAPVITIGAVLASAGVGLIFARGALTAADADAVAGVLRVYLVALFGMCLGNITGRGFYVLHDTRMLALVGVLEAAAYAVYTVGLAAAFGIVGIASGYVIYFNLSIVWHLLILRRRVGSVLNRKFWLSFGRTTAASLTAGAAAWGASMLSEVAAVELLIAGATGLIAYTLALLVLRSSELQLLWVPVGRRLTRLLSQP